MTTTNITAYANLLRVFSPEELQREYVTQVTLVARYGDETNNAKLDAVRAELAARGTRIDGNTPTLDTAQPMHRVRIHAGANLVNAETGASRVAPRALVMGTYGRIDRDSGCMVFVTSSGTFYLQEECEYTILSTVQPTR